MRIAIDSRDAVAPRLRGWGRYVRELAAALERLDEVELVRLDRGWPRLPEAAWEQAGLAGAARRARADVLHVANFLPLRRRLPGVLAVHDLAWEHFPEDFAPRTRRKFAWTVPRGARSADAVIVPTRFTADDLAERYGVEGAHVIPYAASLAAGDAPVPEGPYLLGIGDLRAKKNWGRLVTAWRALRADGLPHRLVIAGVDSGEGPALRAAAAGEPLELPGYVDDRELDALLRGAGALVHPSLWEGFGLVVLEAQVRGVPVVAARATSLPEAGGDPAVYVDPLDPDAIAAGVTDALGRREELAAAGRAHAGAFTWERTARAHLEVFRAAAG